MIFQFNTIHRKSFATKSDSCCKIHSCSMEQWLPNTSHVPKILHDEEVKQASEFVDAHHFIEQLPQGYENKVSEKGSTFSSGERQLIAFARTIAANPKILILDEATANIDSQTEEVIQTSLKKMRNGRTTLAIAHRLSTIQDANQIFVLDKGEIVESGTHTELLEKEGLYYKMYQLQAGMMQE